MDRFNKERTQVRRLFTLAANQIETKLSADPIVKEEVIPLFKILEERAAHLFKLDYSIKEFMLDDENFNEEVFAKELDGAENYNTTWILVKTKYENMLEMKEIDPSIVEQESILGQSKRHFKLPKLELKHFDGDIKNWLGFWGQFRKINDDETIDDDDKFQYLVQATEYAARELVESFPPSGSNYHKALEQLKSRFARDELLIEIYVRELLNLVLAQVTKKGTRSLSTLYDKLETQLRALETLGVTSEKYASMLYPLVESALPEETLRVWERSRRNYNSENGGDDETDHLTSLLQFLKLEVESEERLQIARSSFSHNNGNSIPTAACIFSGEVKGPDKSCLWCNKTSHNPSECFKARNLSLDCKRDLLRKKGACFTCLRVGHNAKRCKSMVRCLICSKRHNVIMCSELPNPSPNKKMEKESKKPIETSSNNESDSVLLTHRTGPILLQTVLVRILCEGKPRLVRALFDNGSQRSYIRSDIPERLNLKRAGQETLSHCLFGGSEMKARAHNVYDITIQSLDGKYQYQMSVLDQAKICGFVPRIENSSLYPLLKQKNIVLSDTGEGAPEIGLLIGADYSGMLMTGSVVCLDKNLTAIRTELGWTIQGPEVKSRSTLNNITLLCNSELADLWSLEVLGIRDPAETKTKDILDQEVTEFFRQSLQVNEESRYEVRLPFKEGHPDLEDNKKLAMKRLMSTTKRLNQTGYIKEYEKVFEEWLQSGVVERVPNDEIASIHGHYLPHHAVIKNSSLTTKVRPVFDASAKDSKGNCLNACLEKGPNLVELIPKLLTLFRRNAIGVTADIRKAFLQISLSPKDRDFARFLWWKNDERKEVETLRLCRVVFGMSPSPFLLGATIAYHLEQAPPDMQNTAALLKQSFYVDNCVTSLHTKEEVAKFITEATELMTVAQFDLRDWITSPTKFTETDLNRKLVSVLGMTWDTENDTMFCHIDPFTVPEDQITKRTLLSVAQRIFDPIGITCPTSLIPKLILQKAWILHCGWDTELPQELKTEFQKWLEQIHLINECRIQRRLSKDPIDNCKLSLHIFCDASKSAYAACVFLRSSYGEDTTVRLILSKSRVSPLKKITIPRLELMAAVIATRLYVQVTQILNMLDCESYFWSDSTVALTWIKKKENWSTFVGNRVKEIRQYTNPNDWHHISGTLNPTDLLSRGCHASTLLKSQWWAGPYWLRLEPQAWPISQFSASETEVNAEKRKTVISSVSCNESKFVLDLSYFSKFSKITRMVAWILRFIHNCRDKERKGGELTSEEVSVAERLIFRSIQKDNFTEDQRKSELKNLEIFTDNYGLLRMKSRVVDDEDVQEYTFPVILPSKHIIVQRMIEQMHLKHNHAGTQTLLMILRERVWILKGRRTVKSVVRKCVICQRHAAKALEVPFPPLPDDRIKMCKTFQVTGVDLAGPVFLKGSKKAWIVIFTCAVFRAVHLELITSLSTGAFLEALRRFIARRGRSEVIYSDNGSNFVGLNKALNQVDWAEVEKQCSLTKIKWKFNPPTAAWWGGFWERLIRILKDLLRKNLGHACLGYEEFSTLLCECENLMNDRPITYISEEGNDLMPLKPSMFLQSLTSNNMTDLDQIQSVSIVERWRYLQKLREALRTRFKREYLGFLQNSVKSKKGEIKLNDIVLIGNDNKKRMDWMLARVVELFPGKDKITRVVKLKTSSGFFLRPIQRLYPIELDPDSSVDPFISSNTTNQENHHIQDQMISQNEDELSSKTYKTRHGREVHPPQKLDL